MVKRAGRAKVGSMVKRENCHRWSVVSPGRTLDKKWIARVAVLEWSFLSYLRTFLTYTLRVPSSDVVRMRGASPLKRTGEEYKDLLLRAVDGGVLWFLDKPRFKTAYSDLEWAAILASKAGELEVCDRISLSSDG